ncbi:TPA: hypothetical protein ACF37V_000809 [Vibrio parahaemolyticus]|nr:hypothetical protein [Vibrio parahaemolyticus]EJG1067258.1 hypothetical protein [Vibrio parahaemolyticus O1]MDF5575784.1 hypothetical protein [Vibrio parahaemolyticus]MDG2903385.1 hypothetical protein [Vibrio parahaemolyticus]
MSLLREIQDAAISSDVELAVLLRKCKVLAARLGSDEFKSWVESELSGYRDIESLPEYRLLEVHSKGHFSGPFNSGLRDADIPLSCIPKDFREGLANSYLVQPVAALEDLVKNSDGSNPREPWNPDFVAHFGQKIYQGMNCMQAWKVIPIGAIVGALDAVRNRVLNFVLEIEAEEPSAGEAPINSNPLPQEKVQQIFHMNISGNVQNLATGSHTFEQHASNNDANAKLFSELLDALQRLNNRELTEPLSQTVEDMRSTQGSESFKGHYQKFMSLLADHMQVLGPVVAPFLPALASVA